MREPAILDVRESVFADNDREAAALRAELGAVGTFLLNLMGSSGAGKSSLILATAAALTGGGAAPSLAVIEADLASDVDARKMEKAGIPSVQLRTGGICHVDAAMVRRGIEALPPGRYDLVILENIGNLICPADFDVGSRASALVLSVPEGDDKPLKYPPMFRACDALVVSKTDVSGSFDFDPGELRRRARDVNPDIAIFETSAKTGAGMADWVAWVESALRRAREERDA